MHLKHIAIQLSVSLCILPAVLPAQSAITLDEFLNTTEITQARLSPDGLSAVIATESPDWKGSIFRHDLWLWTAQAGLRPLTHSGSEENPQWSPDGKWIAFVTDRALPGEPAGAGGEPENEKAKAGRLWLIPASGGEALPLYREKLDVHAFAWSPDGSALYYSVQAPLTQSEQDAQKEAWKDVIRWREQLRGDLLLKQSYAPALARALAVEPPGKTAAAKPATAEPATTLPPDAATIAKSSLTIEEIAPSPDGKTLAFRTGPVHHRTENPADSEIFVVSSAGGEARQITHNEAL
jgi:dipeptidyl aminopeptidase/acylaminoacyl peptidase